LKRARDAYESLVDYVEQQVAGVWAHSAEVVSSVIKKGG
jgi:chromosome partitioning protein